MAASDATLERDRRAAFLAAVRQGQFEWAVQLGNQGVAVTAGDLRFAIKTCFAAGRCDVSVESFLPCCKDEETKRKVSKCFLKEAIHSGIAVDIGRQLFSNFMFMATGVLHISDQPVHNRGTEIEYPKMTSAGSYTGNTEYHSVCTSM